MSDQKISESRVDAPVIPACQSFAPFNKDQAEYVAERETEQGGLWVAFPCGGHWHVEERARNEIADARARIAELESVVEAARDALPHFKTTMGGQTARLILSTALARLDALPTHTEGGEG